MMIEKQNKRIIELEETNVEIKENEIKIIPRLNIEPLYEETIKDKCMTEEYKNNDDSKFDDETSAQDDSIEGCIREEGENTIEGEQE